MPKLDALLLATVLTSSPVTAAAQEIKLVKFICTSQGGVIDVVARLDDLIIGLSPLPSGCAWLPPNTYGIIGETMIEIDAPRGRFARVSRVTLDGRVGFSAGLTELLS